MIELYKIIAGKYDSEITEWITGKCIERQYDTRNHRFALQQSHIHYDIRKFSFSNRIIPLWNSLPDSLISYLKLDLGVTRPNVIRLRLGMSSGRLKSTTWRKFDFTRLGKNRLKSTSKRLGQ